MTDATELDEAAIRACVRDVLSRTPDHLLGVRDVTVNGAQVLRVLDEITRLRAALDEARAEVEHWRGMHDDATAQLRLSIRETTEARAKCAGLSDLAAEKNARAEAAESALAAVQALAEPNGAWKGAKHVRLTRRDSRLGCDITESYIKVDDLRDALATPTTSEEAER